MAKDLILNFKSDSGMRDALDALASARHRTRSELLRQLVMDAVEGSATGQSSKLLISVATAPAEDSAPEAGNAR